MDQKIKYNEMCKKRTKEHKNTRTKEQEAKKKKTEKQPYHSKRLK